MDRLISIEQNFNVEHFFSNSFYACVLNMPCDKCEKKLKPVITPEVWKEGAKNVKPGYLNYFEFFNQHH